MKLLHKTTLKMLPGPFLAALGTLMFLLLMQFLIRHLPDIAGRDLPLAVIFELIVYNLAYMMVLAVPMSVLLASLMAFGKLGESRAYGVVKNAGISLWQLLWPSTVAGLVLVGCMMYFNNEVLPEANFRARNLWQDIRQKKPAFELEPGVFYDGIRQYSLRAGDIVSPGPEQPDELRDVSLIDYSEGDRNKTVVTARRGYLAMRGSGRLDLTLFEGEVHRMKQARMRTDTDRYERLRFDRYRLSLDLSEFDFERTDVTSGSRTDRTMRTIDMVRYVDSLDVAVADRKAALFRSVQTLRGFGGERAFAYDAGAVQAADSLARLALVASWPGLAGLDTLQRNEIYNYATQDARSVLNQIESTLNNVKWEAQQADRYRVEIHKKYSIAAACVIFVLIGAPLGLSAKRGGLGIVGAMATVIFLFYWVTLVQGEKFADREFLTPWVGMWAANIACLIIGGWLTLRVALEPRLGNPLNDLGIRLWESVLRVLPKRLTPKVGSDERPEATEASTDQPPATKRA